MAALRIRRGAAVTRRRRARSDVRGATRSRRTRTTRQATPIAVPAHADDIEAISRQIEHLAAARPPRWNADPDDVRRSVLKLVLTLVELIRQLLERQAIRRMESGTLTDGETESVGLALMRLQETVLDLAKQFDISPDELNLDLGPIGKVL